MSSSVKTNAIIIAYYGYIFSANDTDVMKMFHAISGDDTIYQLILMLSYILCLLQQYSSCF